MGTHPIFESDFDCLTAMEIKQSNTELINTAFTRSVSEIRSPRVGVRGISETYSETAPLGIQSSRDLIG